MTCRPVSLKTSQESIVPKTASRGGLDVAQQPLDLGAREVGVDDQAGALADQLGRARPRAARRSGRGAAVLPDERVVDGLAGLGVPGDDGLALVGDPDPGEVASPRSRRRRAPPRRPAGSTSQISAASCSTQPGRGKCWRELAVGATRDPALAVEDEARRPGRPLVDGEDHGGQAIPSGARGRRAGSRAAGGRGGRSRRACGRSRGAERSSSISRTSSPARTTSTVIPISIP